MSEKSKSPPYGHSSSTKESGLQSLDQGIIDHLDAFKDTSQTSSDNLSDRALKLKPTQRLGEQDIIIFALRKINLRRTAIMEQTMLTYLIGGESKANMMLCQLVRKLVRGEDFCFHRA